MATPIWRDIDIALSYANTTYYVLVNGAQVFQGKAVGINDTPIIRVNNIIADYLTQGVPSFGTSGYSQLALVASVLNYQGGRVWSDAVIPDWSYDRNMDYDRMLPLAPIDKRLHPLQTIVASNFSSGSLEMETEYKNGEIDTFSTAYGPEVVSYVPPALQSPPKNLMLTMWGADTVSIDYTFTDGCERFVLYYINAYGGWESLVCSGTSTKSDNYTRQSYKQRYNNNNALERGDVNYLNEIKTTYTLRTGLLTDEGAANMHHLIGTTQAFLQDFGNGGAIIPVNIKDNSVEAKTFRSNGRRPVQYTIKVEEAYDKIRR